MTHDAVSVDWDAGWLQWQMKDEMRAVADEYEPAPRFFVRDLAAAFGVSVLMSPVAHPDLNPIEVVCGLLKMALKRGNPRFISSSLKDAVAKKFDKITLEAGAKYEDHAIRVEDCYSGLTAARPSVDKE